MKKIKINKEDRQKLAELYQTAQTTPMIAPDLGAALRGKDLATIAWDKVRDFANVLGYKYNFDPKNSSINRKTGEVMDLKDVKFNKTRKRFQLTPPNVKDERES